MSEPVSIIAEITLSEAAFKRFINAKPKPFSRYDDWGNARHCGMWNGAEPEGSGKLQPDPGTAIKHQIAANLSTIVDCESGLLICRYEPETGRMLYLHTFPGDWWLLARAELAMLRRAADYKDVSERDYAIVSAAPPYAASLEELHAVLAIDVKHSELIEPSTMPRQTLAALRDRLFDAYVQAESTLPDRADNELMQAWYLRLTKQPSVLAPPLHRAWSSYQRRFERAVIIAQASPEHHEWLLPPDLLTDGRHVFLIGGDPLEGANPHTIQRVSEWLYCDGDRVYWMSRQIEGATSCTIIGGSYWHDGERIFYNGDCLLGTTAQSFRMEGRYLVAGTKVYQWGKLVPEFSGVDFRAIGWHYVVADNQVYYEQEAVPGADPATFVELPAPALAKHDILHAMVGKDAHTVYYGATPWPEAEASTFRRISECYGIDSRHIFRIGEEDGGLILGSHRPSFRFLSWAFAADRAQVYQNGKVLPGATPETFTVLDDSLYGRDGDTIYYGSGPLSPPYDVASFTVTDWCSANDAFGEFSYGRRVRTPRRRRALSKMGE